MTLVEQAAAVRKGLKELMGAMIQINHVEKPEPSICITFIRLREAEPEEFLKIKGYAEHNDYDFFEDSDKNKDGETLYYYILRPQVSS